MKRMVRKQIVIDAEQERELAIRARALGISQSEFVRRALESTLSEAESTQSAAWKRARSVMLDASGLRTGSGALRWTREELHERSGRGRH